MQFAQSIIPLRQILTFRGGLERYTTFLFSVFFYLHFFFFFYPTYPGPHSPSHCTLLARSPTHPGIAFNIALANINSLATLALLI